MPATTALAVQARGNFYPLQAELGTNAYPTVSVSATREWRPRSGSGTPSTAKRTAQSPGSRRAGRRSTAF